MGKKALADWTVSQGITEDKEKGTLSLDTSVEQFGKFSIVVPAGSDRSDDSADDSDDTDDTDNGGDVDIPDDGDLDDNDAGIDVTPADPSQTAIRSINSARTASESTSNRLPALRNSSFQPHNTRSVLLRNSNSIPPSATGICRTNP